MTYWYPYIGMTVVLTIVAGIGMWSTDVGAWYKGLKKPSWQPPDWLFGPAWTTIYCFMIASTGMAWNAANAEQQTVLLWLIAVNLVLNMLWSIVFFKLKQPRWAIVEVVVLWASILAWLVYTYSVNATSGLLLIPYIAWVTVAAYLTITLSRLNPMAHVSS